MPEKNAVTWTLMMTRFMQFGFPMIPGLAGLHVLAEVELADTAGDLADFPAMETGIDEL